MSDYFIYHVENWFIAVDALNHKDAARYIRSVEPRAVYVGKGAKLAPVTTTGMITPGRQEEIITNNARWIGRTPPTPPVNERESSVR